MDIGIGQGVQEGILSSLGSEGDGFFRATSGVYSRKWRRMVPFSGPLRIKEKM
jgi:hypothetical protein